MRAKEMEIRQNGEIQSLSSVQDLSPSPPLSTPTEGST